MRSAIAALTCAAFLVAGCQTQNAYSGEQQTSNATRGAVAGAAGGAGNDGGLAVQIEQFHGGIPAFLQPASESFE